MKLNRIAIIGGGAAGLFAAASLTNTVDNEVTVFEKNEYTGKKLMITGKGRCNVTTSCDREEFFKNVPVNSKFLYSSFNSFSNQDTIEFFENLGLELKIERGQRVFPASDKAKDVRDTLLNRAKALGVNFVYSSVLDVDKTDNTFFIKTKSRTYEFDKVIIATGGVSYKSTGSTGDGYTFAEKFSHKIVTPKPSLVPFICKEKWCYGLMGLGLKNISLKIIDKENKKTVYEDFGEMLFTHYGVSGPVILSASSHLRNLSEQKEKYVLVIDLKPALDSEKLDKRILSDFSLNINRDFSNSLSDLLPSKLIPVIIELSGISPKKKVCEITKVERNRLVSLLKNLTLTIVGTRPINEAIITSGGVSVSEINPKTMESKLVSGLYFAGEIIDVDAYTGGFNLQIAFSTARAAITNAEI
ncbi:MAG: NAD(P)/FAD-dependent oxidoreductase [Ruminococcaceae bacterium]|nr:NAD(P)/FAD-dependent oxidoreductase [Oscillospiraceae bacterium]